LASASTQRREQPLGGWVRLVSPRQVGADVTAGLRGNADVAHVGAAGESEAGDKGDADPGADEGGHEAVVTGAAGDTGLEAADGGEHVEYAADLAPPVDPAFVGELGQADGRPSGQRVARGNQQPEVVSGERGVAARSGGGRPAARRLGRVEVVDEREIGLAVADRTQRLIRLGLDHRDLHGLTGQGQLGQRGREQRLPGTGKRDHGQGLRSVGLQGAQLLRGCLQLGVDRVGGGDQQPAGVGEDNAARAALHEHHAGASFECGDLLRHRRRRMA
jgi:hypothetical protein